MRTNPSCQDLVMHQILSGKFFVFLFQYDVEHNVEYPQLENRPDFESFGIEMEEVWFTGRNSSMMFGKVCTW